MTKLMLRVGDMVRIEGSEEPVVTITGDFIVTRCANGAGRSMCRRTVENGGLFVMLLRRPIHVGDSIVFTGGGRQAAPITVSHVYSDMLKFSNGAQMWLKPDEDPEAWKAWRHADGVAIDPPKHRTTKPAELTGQQLAERNGAWTAAVKAGETYEIALDATMFGDVRFPDQLAAFIEAVKASTPGTIVHPEGVAMAESIRSAIDRIDAVSNGSANPGYCHTHHVYFTTECAACVAAMSGVACATCGSKLRPHETFTSFKPNTPGAFCSMVHMREAEVVAKSNVILSSGLLPASDSQVLNLRRGEAYLRIGDDSGPHIIIKNDGTVSLWNCSVDDGAIAFWGAVSKVWASSAADPTVRALFETDPEVLAYVRTRADAAMPPETVSRWSTSLGRTETVRVPSTVTFTYGPKIKAAMQIAWDIGKMSMAENATKAERETVEAIGYRRAMERAEAMRAVQR